jgi:hypothetical protein
MASSACAIVTVDINPSFSIQVNSTQASYQHPCNQCRRPTLYPRMRGARSFTGSPVAEAVARIIQLAREAGYLPENQLRCGRGQVCAGNDGHSRRHQDVTVDDAEASAIDKDEVRSQQ